MIVTLLENESGFILVKFQLYLDYDFITSMTLALLNAQFFFAFAQKV